MRLFLVILGLTLAGIFSVVWSNSHYAAPLICVVYGLWLRRSAICVECAFHGCNLVSHYPGSLFSCWCSILGHNSAIASVTRCYSPVQYGPVARLSSKNSNICRESI